MFNMELPGKSKKRKTIRKIPVATVGVREEDRDKGEIEADKPL